MHIINAEFIKSCVTPDQFPPASEPELACLGRSNVGKSSLINSLLNRRRLANVSGTPGKTRLLNFFRVSTAQPELRQFHVVDLPGYGYAKVSKSIRDEWGPMIEQYLTSHRSRRGALLLVDARDAQRLDVIAWSWVKALDGAAVVVATKLDKLRREEREACLAGIRRTLGLAEHIPVIGYSSVTREGRDDLWRVIYDMLAESRGGK